MELVPIASIDDNAVLLPSSECRQAIFAIFDRGGRAILQQRAFESGSARLASAI
jgi:hypothetical protein